MAETATATLLWLHCMYEHQQTPKTSNGRLFTWTTKQRKNQEKMAWQDREDCKTLNIMVSAARRLTQDWQKWMFNEGTGLHVSAPPTQW